MDRRARIASLTIFWALYGISRAADLKRRRRARWRRLLRVLGAA